MSTVWTVKTILDWIEQYLAEKGIRDSRLSAQWLVSDVLGCTRIELYTMLQRVLTEEERTTLRAYTSRRAAGEPLQYITGTCGFRFLTLAVEPGVLIPRPETEVLVSEAIAALQKAFPAALDEGLPDVYTSNLEGATLVHMEHTGLFLQPEAGEPVPVALDDEGDIIARPSLQNQKKQEPLVVLDLCTGSGNIACSIASELSDVYVYATDISPAAHALATRNVHTLGLQDRVEVLLCDIGALIPKELHGKVSLVVSNPPYIPSSVLKDIDSEVADFEPHLALDGGSDGLELFRRIASFAQSLLRPGGVLAVELHETCLHAAAAWVIDRGFKDAAIIPDLAGKDRVLIAHVA